HLPVSVQHPGAQLQRNTHPTRRSSDLAVGQPTLIEDKIKPDKMISCPKEACKKVGRYVWVPIIVIPKPTTAKLEPKKVGLVNTRSEEHTSELQSRFDLVCRLLLEKKKH